MEKRTSPGQIIFSTLICSASFITHPALTYPHQIIVNTTYTREFKSIQISHRFEGYCTQICINPFSSYSVPVKVQGSKSVTENLCKLRVSSALKTGFYDDALNLGKVPECRSGPCLSLADAMLDSDYSPTITTLLQYFAERQ